MSSVGKEGMLGKYVFSVGGRRRWALVGGTREGRNGAVAVGGGKEGENGY